MGRWGGGGGGGGGGGCCCDGSGGYLASLLPPSLPLQTPLPPTSLHIPTITTANRTEQNKRKKSNGTKRTSLFYHIFFFVVFSYCCCVLNSVFISFFWVPQLYFWGSPFLGEIFAYVTVFCLVGFVLFCFCCCFCCCCCCCFNPTIEIVTFRLRGWCMLGVLLLPAFTRLGHECQDLLSPGDGIHVCTD